MPKWRMILQDIQQDLDAGNLGDIYVRDDELEGGPDIPLSELQARQQQQERDEQAASPTADEEDLAGISGSSSSKDGIISFSPDAAAPPAAEDLQAVSGPMSPASDRIQPETPLPEVGSSVSGILDSGEEQERPSSCADTDVAARIDNGTASTGVRPHSEERESPADKEDEARKLAKQQELFGKSFSKPKRSALFISSIMRICACKPQKLLLLGSLISLLSVPCHVKGALCPHVLHSLRQGKPLHVRLLIFVALCRPVATAIDREELSESALSDPLTPRENRAVESQVASAPAPSGRPTLDQVEQDTAAAGKAFMDGLAQNVRSDAELRW